MNEALNEKSLTSLCSALAYAMGIDAPTEAAAANETLCTYVDEALGGKKADRIFMYNPDAIAQWIYEKYPTLFRGVDDTTGCKLPLRTVMPSVTPVCFGTMYTGAEPSVHGIQKYEKPVIAIDTLFDALLRAGKKPAIVAYGKSSLSMIYLEREMDYYLYPTMDEANAKAAELILRDEHDFILLYNGNYDSAMHKTGTESPLALGELRANVRTYSMLRYMLRQHWQSHNVLLGFAMDHGCHDIDEGAGSHGLDMPEDLNIVHFYEAWQAEEAEA